MEADKPTIGFLHTFPFTISMVESFMKQCLPGVSGFHHILDTLMKRDNNIISPGITPKANIIRYAHYAKNLETSGCDLIFSCCSLMRQAVDYCKAILDIPIYQLDEFAIRAAVEAGPKIAVIAANFRVVPHIEKAIAGWANILHKKALPIIKVNDDAYKAMNRDDMPIHDKLLLKNISEVTGEADCILLGQINLASLENQIAAMNLDKPVFCAGKQTFNHIKTLLSKNNS
jgi:Asp/Glu/hydantoin racemase